MAGSGGDCVDVVGVAGDNPEGAGLVDRSVPVGVGVGVPVDLDGVGLDGEGEGEGERLREGVGDAAGEGT